MAKKLTKKDLVAAYKELDKVAGIDPAIEYDELSLEEFEKELYITIDQVVEEGDKFSKATQAVFDALAEKYGTEEEEEEEDDDEDEDEKKPAPKKKGPPRKVRKSNQEIADELLAEKADEKTILAAFKKVYAERAITDMDFVKKRAGIYMDIAKKRAGVKVTKPVKAEKETKETKKIVPLKEEVKQDVPKKKKK